MNCVICNKEIKESMFSNNILCSEECFKIDFWNEYANKSDDLNSVRINHEHYWILPNVENKNISGFGGRQFKIIFNDGRKVITNNLWNQGSIPEEFYEKLPDNAKFEI